MTRQAKRELRLKARAIARQAIKPYQPENDMLWQQEQARSGGGMAGWVLYDANPSFKREWSMCKLTGRWNKNVPYRIVRSMPTGTWPAKLDKRIP